MVILAGCKGPIEERSSSNKPFLDTEYFEVVSANQEQNIHTINLKYIGESKGLVGMRGNIDVKPTLQVKIGTECSLSSFVNLNSKEEGIFEVQPNDKIKAVINCDKEGLSSLSFQFSTEDISNIQSFKLN